MIEIEKRWIRFEGTRTRRRRIYWVRVDGELVDRCLNFKRARGVVKALRDAAAAKVIPFRRAA